MKLGRSLVKRKDGRVVRWGCDSCAWMRPNLTTIGEPRENLHAAFHMHRCEQNQMAQKSVAEHFMPLNNGRAS